MGRKFVRGALAAGLQRRTRDDAPSPKRSASGRSLGPSLEAVPGASAIGPSPLLRLEYQPPPCPQRSCSWPWRVSRRCRNRLRRSQTAQTRRPPSGCRRRSRSPVGPAFIESLVDQDQRFAHREGLARSVQHLGVAGVDRHARADGGLRQIDRRDVALAQVSQGHRQFRLEGHNEFAAGGHRRVRRALATDQDDTGGEGVGAHTDHSIAEFCAHWPSASD